jgi:hypothetical protein
MYEIYCFLIAGHQPVAIQLQENACRRQRSALVAVDKGMVLDQRVRKRRCLGPQVRVQVISPECSLWTGQRRIEEPYIAEATTSACLLDQAGVQEKNFVEGQVFHRLLFGQGLQSGTIFLDEAIHAIQKAWANARQ